MNKKELRKLYHEKRIQLSTSERLKLNDLILIQFQQLAFQHVSNVLTYWPLEDKKEVNTYLITDFLAFRMPGMQLCFPVMDPATSTFKPVAVNDDSDFKLNRFGIGEPSDGEELDPEEIDLVITPLLCFDEKGYRVGYGKGFYDRFFPLCRPDVIKLGFSYFEPLHRITDIDEFDVPLNACITPKKIYEF